MPGTVASDGLLRGAAIGALVFGLAAFIAWLAPLQARARRCEVIWERERHAGASIPEELRHEVERTLAEAYGLKGFDGPYFDVDLWPVAMEEQGGRRTVYATASFEEYVARGDGLLEEGTGTGTQVKLVFDRSGDGTERLLSHEAPRDTIHYDQAEMDRYFPAWVQEHPSFGGVACN